MGLPYERQIFQLLQEHSHYRVVVRHCRQENAKYTDELEKTCREIERAVYEMEEKQQMVLSQWRNTDEQERIRISFPVADGVEKMIELAEKKGCGAIGKYLEFTIMEEILGLLDQVEIYSEGSSGTNSRISDT